MHSRHQHFDKYVCPGDTVTIEDGLFTFTARIEFDGDSRPTDDEGMSAEAIEAWKQDEWFYCGIALSATYNGVALPDNYLASLWGIEANFPGSDNSYLSEVVRELLPEAKAEAQKHLETMRAKLAA